MSADPSRPPNQPQPPTNQPVTSISPGYYAANDAPGFVNGVYVGGVLTDKGYLVRLPQAGEPGGPPAPKTTAQHVVTKGPGYEIATVVQATDSISAARQANTYVMNDPTGITSVQGDPASGGTVIQRGVPEQNQFWVERGLPQYANYGVPKLTPAQEAQGDYIKVVSAGPNGPQIQVGNKQNEVYWQSAGLPQYADQYEVPVLTADQVAQGYYVKGVSAGSNGPQILLSSPDIDRQLAQMQVDASKWNQAGYPQYAGQYLFPSLPEGSKITGVSKVDQGLSIGYTLPGQPLSEQLADAFNPDVNRLQNLNAMWHASGIPQQNAAAANTPLGGGLHLSDPNSPYLGKQFSPSQVKQLASQNALAAAYQNVASGKSSIIDLSTLAANQPDMLKVAMQIQQQNQTVMASKQFYGDLAAQLGKPELAAFGGKYAPIDLSNVPQNMRLVNVTEVPVVDNSSLGKPGLVGSQLQLQFSPISVPTLKEGFTPLGVQPNVGRNPITAGLSDFFGENPVVQEIRSLLGTDQGQVGVNSQGQVVTKGMYLYQKDPVGYVINAATQDVALLTFGMGGFSASAIAKLAVSGPIVAQAIKGGVSEIRGEGWQWLTRQEIVQAAEANIAFAGVLKGAGVLYAASSLANSRLAMGMSQEIAPVFEGPINQVSAAVKGTKIYQGMINEINPVLNPVTAIRNAAGGTLTESYTRQALLNEQYLNDFGESTGTYWQPTLKEKILMKVVGETPTRPAPGIVSFEGPAEIVDAAGKKQVVGGLSIQDLQAASGSFDMAVAPGTSGLILSRPALTAKVPVSKLPIFFGLGGSDLLGVKTSIDVARFEYSAQVTPPKEPAGYPESMLDYDYRGPLSFKKTPVELASEGTKKIYASSTPATRSPTTLNLGAGDISRGSAGNVLTTEQLAVNAEGIYGSFKSVSVVEPVPASLEQKSVDSLSPVIISSFKGKPSSSSIAGSVYMYAPAYEQPSAETKTQAPSVLDYIMPFPGTQQKKKAAEDEELAFVSYPGVFTTPLPVPDQLLVPVQGQKLVVVPVQGLTQVTQQVPTQKEQPNQFLVPYNPAADRLQPKTPEATIDVLVPFFGQTSTPKLDPAERLVPFIGVFPGQTLTPTVDVSQPLNFGVGAITRVDQVAVQEAFQVQVPGFDQPQTQIQRIKFSELEAGRYISGFGVPSTDNFAHVPFKPKAGKAPNFGSQKRAYPIVNPDYFLGNNPFRGQGKRIKNVNPLVQQKKVNPFVQQKKVNPFVQQKKRSR